MDNLERLLEEMMQAVIDHVGADKGTLLLEEDGEWVVKATQPFQADGVPPHCPSKVPVTLIHTVVRTREPVVWHHAFREEIASCAPDIIAQHPPSILCLPLVKQGELTGILYLENILTIDMFLSERPDILKLLASQIAISLEHAQLYAHLAHKVKERTQELEVEKEKLRQSEQRAHRLKETAEAANQAKSTFLSKISHELRTPLNAILDYTQNLRRDQGLTVQQSNAVAAIHRSSEQLLRLINDLLDLSRIELDKIELQPRAFPFPQFLKNLVENARVHARQKGITLNADMPSDLPAYVFGDEHRLRQILQNLLTNAIKFTEKGRVELRIANCGLRIEQSEIRNPKSEINKSQISNLKFQISDTGTGIPAEHLEDIFLPFYQIDGGRCGTEGTGLGLDICRRLVRLMGGELRVKSTVGQGTTFWFEIDLPVPDTPHIDRRTRPEPLSRIAVPAQETLNQLAELAKGGYINDLQEIIAQLKASDSGFVPFTSHIEALLEKFLFDEIGEYLQTLSPMRNA